MRRIIIFILISIVGLPLFSQDVHYPSMILASGGSSLENNASVSLSNWRLARMHVITIPENMLSKGNDRYLDLSGDMDLVTPYPNPVEDMLYLRFQIQVQESFHMRLTDVLGRNLLIRELNDIQPEQTLEVDLSGLAPALYLLHIATENRKSARIFPIEVR